MDRVARRRGGIRNRGEYAVRRNNECRGLGRCRAQITKEPFGVIGWYVVDESIFIGCTVYGDGSVRKFCLGEDNRYAIVGSHEGAEVIPGSAAVQRLQDINIATPDVHEPVEEISCSDWLELGHQKSLFAWINQLSTTRTPLRARNSRATYRPP